MPSEWKFPGPVPKEALEFFRKKGLTPSFSWTDVWSEEHQVSFTVAKILELDVLATVRGSLERALEDGQTFEQWRKDIKGVLDKSGWSAYQTGTKKGDLRRLRTIFDTNMRTARATGQHERVQRTKRVLPYLRYEVGPARKHTDTCLSWSGTILPVDDPWWEDHWPPNHYLCTGHVIQIGEREVDRRGGVTGVPSSYDVEWKLPDGTATRSPVGVHPSFRAVGRSRTDGLDDALRIAEKRK